MPQLLMERIKIYNDHYRAGEPSISDSGYDELLLEVENELSDSLYKTFRESLCEPGGDVKLANVAGSLRKTTYGTDQLEKYCSKFDKKVFFISAKLDGMGYVATYVNGVISTVTTTGDGVTAKNITHNAKYCLPNMINVEGLFIVRGELVMEKEDAIELGYKNARNGVVGLMKKDKADYEKLKFVRCPAYQIMNAPDMSYADQYKILSDKFEVPLCQAEDVSEFTKFSDFETHLVELLESWKSRKYLIDGLVISHIDANPENVKLPNQTVAFKVNADEVKTKVIGMDIVTSKDGVLNGVAMLEPVEINGTTVTRAAIYNFDNVLEKGIGRGAEVVIVKAGEIIPKIIKVLKTADIQEELYWSKCTECGTETVHDDSVNMICPNEHCDARKYGAIETFIKNCDIKGASETSFRNWGISEFWELIYFVPVSKAQIKFYSEFEKIAFSLSKEELMTKFNWTGAGQRTLAKYIKHLTLDGFIASASVGSVSLTSHPEGTGELTWNKIVDKFDMNYKNFKLIIQDERYKPVVEESKVQSSELAGKSFCCTGKVSRPRKEIEADIVSAGGEIKSVSKNLDYLVAGEKAGSKLIKAEKLGIKVITEAQLQEMLK